MADKFMNAADTASGPSRAPYPIVPHDTNPLPFVPKGIYIGTGGNVTLRGVDGATDVVYKNMPSASYIAVAASHVRAAGTTASDMIAEA